jgi:hypothetical protein
MNEDAPNFSLPENPATAMAPGEGDGPVEAAASVAPWSAAASAEASHAARLTLKVSFEQASLRTDPELLPEQPREISGRFELLPLVARRALELGLAAREPTFHVFVAADPDVMIDADVVRYAERFARRKHGSGSHPAPPDLAYVHDFDRPEAPRPFVLPAGAATELANAMDQLVDDLLEAVPSTTEADDIKRSLAAMSHELDVRTRHVLGGLETTAKGFGFGVRSVHGGVQTFPVLHGKPLTTEQFDALDEVTKRALGASEDRLTREVDKAARLVKAESARFEAQRDEAYAAAARAVIADHAGRALARFEALGDDVRDWTQQVMAALAEDWEDFIDGDADALEAEGGSDPGRDFDPEHATRLHRFKVNVLVANEPSSHAPVVYDTNPTYPHLFGYLERRARFGALQTDFTRIRPGSIHQATGGVLVVRAADVLADPILWERLKRVLRERRIGAEDPLGPLGLYATSLRPVPVPVRVRVVLIGPPELYALLLDGDPDFAALFRVKVEVERSIVRTPEQLLALDAYLMAMAAERGWGEFGRGARARLLDLATRLAGDRERLTLSLLPLEETAAFASALAAARATSDEMEPLEAAGAAIPAPADSAPFRASIVPPSLSVVSEEDIDIAWRERRERLGSTERNIRDLMLRGEISLDTDGARVGVINGLSVFSAGDVEFGQPMRITAVVALGREGIIDVEREAQLGGSVHTKGVAILRGYLGRMFGQERPLSLRAQLAFEQSYGEIDGDSASGAELFAVLSGLADVPIDQSIAVTGSVNQLGEIQAIGGLCAKIEGFFDLCAARGLTGRQGVMMPRSNLPHLVLRADVVRAIEHGLFHLYAFDSVAQGIELLTGVAAGERDEAGRLPAWSVFGRVERRLIEIAERLREAEAPLRSEARDVPDDPSEGDPGDLSHFRGRRDSPPGRIFG